MFFTVRHLSPVFLKLHFHWRYFKAKTQATLTLDSHYGTCLGHLGRGDTDRIISILCHAAHGGQGKYSSECRMSLSLSVSLTIFTKVNDS